MPTPEQIAKLPKWAQMHIQKLTYDIRYYKEREVEMLGGNVVNSREEMHKGVILDPYSESGILLPTDRVRYGWGFDVGYFDIRKSDRVEHGIRITGQPIINVLPESYNSITIEVVGR